MLPRRLLPLLPPAAVGMEMSEEEEAPEEEEEEEEDDSDDEGLPFFTGDWKNKRR